ncbi:HPr family phosphocarrier protein [Proteiniclasticum sp. QWL-01]|uniref:HPr family phosphocarrier protein n=1 Tax=Proteiniclasticum sp. QWL-01 TaxID=3036945 RepID=UPI00220B2C66|nr:HPr family phosphocarrier protein [Proteiniclasticum sp. QWL-01]UUM13304.1 HPr family phosphocarrier protein [Clostridiaceae bacterium HFYG-1003]WFF71733.1 HPr family phosphocarrier protein [Proteiniclasticum sp. QWL-01]
MVQREVIVVNESGIHARPAAAVVNFVKSFKGTVDVTHNNKRGNLKSIISIMSLGMRKGSALVLDIEGEDEEQFADRLVNFISSLEG